MEIIKRAILTVKSYLITIVDELPTIRAERKQNEDYSSKQGKTD